MKLESGLSVNVEPLNIAHLWHRVRLIEARSPPKHNT